MTRRFLTGLLLALPLWAEVGVHRIGAIAIPVSRLEPSIEFFTTVLDFEPVSQSEAVSPDFDRLTGVFGTNVRVATLRLGRQEVQLIEYVTPEGRAVPADMASTDAWFQHIAIVVSDMDKAYARLREHRVRQISTAPQTLPLSNHAAAGIRAFYFKDPDNHPLELICFPSGKGDPKWQQHGGRLFLGIDHTAIAVSDTEAGLRFYRDLLGLRVAGNSLNYGTEQEHLNHVFGSRVRITGLRAVEGPGIEFLEYVAPRIGRAYPRDSRPNDLWNLHTTVHVPSLGEAVERLRQAGVEFISSGPAPILPLTDGPANGVLVRDPDGHAVLVRGK